jgi:hypothetical protein
MELSRAKTRATAEAGSKKRHFYKPLPIRFRKEGFNYRQIIRDGNAAIYEQTWNGWCNPSIAYEAIRVRHREGFQINGRFVEPAEVYPKSEAWGVDGRTVLEQRRGVRKRPDPYNACKIHRLALFSFVKSLVNLPRPWLDSATFCGQTMEEKLCFT